MRRRNFLQMSSAVTAANTFDFLPKYINDKPSNSELILLATNWGYYGSLSDFCTKIKNDGYHGAEIWWPSEKKEQENLLSTFKDFGLKLGLLCGVGEHDPTTHINQYKDLFSQAVKNKILTPLYINNHAGKDFFDFATNKKIIELSYAIAKGSGIPIYHESHRGRILYNLPLAIQFLKDIPELRLTLDISHWCNVHESLLEGQEKNVKFAIERTGHIHARVGHAEGPQVSDPRAPEWDYAVKQHLAWWDEVVTLKSAKKEPITILTEFGPADYMPTLPYTRQPVADLWDVNVYMMKTLRDRYIK